MNPWIECAGYMPSAIRPDDELVIKLRTGMEHRRIARDCDWSQNPALNGDIVRCRIVDPTDIIKEVSATSFSPMEARNAYIVGPLALYVHDAPEAELRKAMADIQRYFEVFINAAKTG